ncbi:Sodium/calcium exchanger protein-domain-containing protein [Zopfochytrium polystomum]|nr:Sodium/calcium exchanger protein-domain-containing protein [Zopfochytrium polystomum]
MIAPLSPPRGRHGRGSFQLPQHGATAAIIVATAYLIYVVTPSVAAAGATSAKVLASPILIAVPQRQDLDFVEGSEEAEPQTERFQQNVTCATVWEFEGDKCDFVREHCPRAEGFLDYTKFHFCTMKSAPYLSFPMLATILAYLFLFLSITAGDYFCANLSSISFLLGLSETVAGVTLAALGNGSPDIFGTFTAIRAGSGALALGELMGACLFVTLVVVGVICLPGPVRLPRRPFLRDTAFLFGCVGILFIFLMDGRITVIESLLLVVYYLIYVSVVVIGHFINKRYKEDTALQADRESTIEIEDSPSEEALLWDATFLTDVPRDGMYRSRDYRAGYVSRLNRDLYPFLASLNARPVSLSPSNESSLFELPPTVATNDTSAPVLNQREESEESEERHNSRDELVSRLFPLLTSLDSSGTGIYDRIWAWVASPIVFMLRSTIPVLHRREVETVHSSVQSMEDLSPLLTTSGRPAVRRYGSNGTSSSSPEMSPESNEDEADEEDDLPEIFRPRRLTAEENFWDASSLLLVAQLALIPILLAVDVSDFETLGLTTAILAIGVVCSVIIGVLAYRILPTASARLKHWIMASTGFTASIIWIHIVVTEIVGLLKTFGLLLGISDAVLGMTVFAIGNSLGDLTTNYSMAQMGLPMMAMGACFGTPLMNMLIGVGGTVLVNSIGGSQFVLELDPRLTATLCATLVSLLVTVAAAFFNDFQLTPFLGKIMIAEYALISIVILHFL